MLGALALTEPSGITKLCERGEHTVTPEWCKLRKDFGK
jgi:hypothetical protein